MKAVGKLINTQNVELTISFTTTVSDWERLSAQLKSVGAYPAWSFDSALREVLSMALDQVSSEHITKEGP